jgi:hypothetical protein
LQFQFCFPEIAIAFWRCFKTTRTTMVHKPPTASAKASASILTLSSVMLQVVVGYQQRSRVHVVRLSSELPCAVGVRKYTAESITLR